MQRVAVWLWNTSRAHDAKQQKYVSTTYRRKLFDDQNIWLVDDVWKCRGILKAMDGRLTMTNPTWQVMCYRKCIWKVVQCKLTVVGLNVPWFSKITDHWKSLNKRAHTLYVINHWKPLCNQCHENWYELFWRFTRRSLTMANLHLSCLCFQYQDLLKVIENSLTIKPLNSLWWLQMQLYFEGDGKQFDNM